MAATWAIMSTADKLQQLRLERQKSDLSHKLQEVCEKFEQFAFFKNFGVEKGFEETSR